MEVLCYLEPFNVSLEGLEAGGGVFLFGYFQELLVDGRFEYDVMILLFLPNRHNPFQVFPQLLIILLQAFAYSFNVGYQIVIHSLEGKPSQIISLLGKYYFFFLPLVIASGKLEGVVFWILIKGEADYTFVLHVDA